MMDQEQAITSMVAGSILIAAGSLFKKFYASGLYGAGLGRPIKTWQGRALFWSVGGIMFLLGLHFLVRSLI